MKETILKLVTYSDGSQDVICTMNNIHTYKRTATKEDIAFFRNKALDTMGSDQ